jgi:hypothetical protein
LRKLRRPLGGEPAFNIELDIEPVKEEGDEVWDMTLKKKFSKTSDKT